MIDKSDDLKVIKLWFYNDISESREDEKIEKLSYVCFLSNCLGLNKAIPLFVGKVVCSADEWLGRNGHKETVKDRN